MTERCGRTEKHGLWAPLTCGREKGHTGTHIEYRKDMAVGFGLTGLGSFRMFSPPPANEDAA